MSLEIYMHPVFSTNVIVTLYISLLLINVEISIIIFYLFIEF